MNEENDIFCGARETQQRTSSMYFYISVMAPLPFSLDAPSDKTGKEGEKMIQTTTTRARAHGSPHTIAIGHHTQIRGSRGVGPGLEEYESAVRITESAAIMESDRDREKRRESVRRKLSHEPRAKRWRWLRASKFPVPSVSGFCTATAKIR